MAKHKMSDYATTYVAQVRRRGVAASTIRGYDQTCRAFAAWWDKTRRVPKSLAVEDVEEYLYGEDGLAERMQPQSFNARLGQLKRFLEWCTRRGYVRGDVIDACQSMSVDPKEFDRLSLAKVVDMIETCDDEWERWALTVASQTLGRVSELAGLKLGDFNFDTGMLRYYRSKTRDADEIQITPVLAAAYRRWVTYLQDQAGLASQKDWYAIPRRQHVPGRYVYEPRHKRASGLAKMVQRNAARVMGCKPEDFRGQGIHMIRRSMARAFYDQLVEVSHADPMRVVKTMLGHKDVATTERYLGIVTDRVRRNDLLASGTLLWASRENVLQLKPKTEAG